MMVEHVWHYYADCRTLLVGTGDSPLTLPFYHSCGFTYSHTLPDFFTRHYDHPIIEGGMQLKDMIHLKREKQNPQAGQCSPYFRYGAIKDHGVSRKPTNLPKCLFSIPLPHFAFSSRLLHKIPTKTKVSFFYSGLFPLTACRFRFFYEYCNTFRKRGKLRTLGGSQNMTSSTLKERVQATLKSEDTEGTFELYVTRTPGYLWALLFKKLHIHPIAVTLLSIVIGALAGYFFLVGRPIHEPHRHVSPDMGQLVRLRRRATGPHDGTKDANRTHSGRLCRRRVVLLHLFFSCACVSPANRLRGGNRGEYGFG